MPQNPPILADRPPISEAADPLQFLLLALHFSMNYVFYIHIFPLAHFCCCVVSRHV